MISTEYNNIVYLFTCSSLIRFMYLLLFSILLCRQDSSLPLPPDSLTLPFLPSRNRCSSFHSPPAVSVTTPLLSAVCPSPQLTPLLFLPLQVRSHLAMSRWRVPCWPPSWTASWVVTPSSTGRSRATSLRSSWTSSPGGSATRWAGGGRILLVHVYWQHKVPILSWEMHVYGILCANFPMDINVWFTVSGTL